ncbi:unnamed protein product [Rotaria socialis]|uniref:O-acyltransferase n=1 Tax=Rotaria socialis TaxID=392032 RepID=A0A818NDQ7_9BILA|nr:unnamed protein product [Rotaria socialis]CAF3399941.1 unnamed protein product [Rotaria socialis]CAF3572355.1 unnamed protein product [Rotaria socialis]CAF3603303.1 unnamed protein product [Rotaria socialis]CAF3743784.1 unnamed protein product [Rotaria socialis]
MESTATDTNDSQWINQETEKIHAEILLELNRFESSLNERFAEFKHTVTAQQEETALANASNHQIAEFRVFIPRNSVLTDLFKISHIRGVRNVFAAMLIILVIQVTLNDIIQEGRVNLHFEIMFQCFANLHVALFIWLLMMLSTTIVVFLGFYLWAKHRNDYHKTFKLYDRIWLSIYITYVILFLVFPSREITKHKFGGASAIVILLEQLRQIMKVHAFVRENVPKVLSVVERKAADKKFVCPDFSQYLYFLFAPTLIYRDQYPRNPTIRWNFVLQMFGQVIASVFYVYYVVVRFCIPTFESLNQEEITLSIFVSVIFNSIMPGSLFLLLAFYGFLHCWLNAFAEMLRFADRMFYKDWWNSTSFAAYYRTWNVVVHDWLHAYVYREIYVLTGRKNRTVPAICVILLSAAFHEYVMGFTLGFFFPIMFFLFGVVGLVFLLFLPRHRGVAYNILMWVLLLIGMGVQSSFYFMESYARKECPRNDTFWDDITPRSFSCRITLPSSEHSKIDL